MFIARELHSRIKERIQENKVVLIYGPRRVGKTTLVKEISQELKEKGEKVMFANGENIETQEELSSQSIEKLKRTLAGVDVLILDEAQKISEAGLNLKLIVDHIPHIKVIASGSASFDLAQKVGEPLVGRKFTFHLYPLSIKEIVEFRDLLYYKSFFEDHLIFGGYPEVFNLESSGAKKDYLKEIVDSYLFKDIFEFESIKNHKKIKDLLVLLALQIGKEVSLSELSNKLDIHIDTVSRFLDLLEKSFIVINIRGFSRNLRKEVTKTSRYYFYDNGIRNALISNFNNPQIRNDIGELWENYVVMERLKQQTYSSIRANNYFWRTYDQKEIDWVEEREGKLFGYEIKWDQKKAKEPQAWKQTYKNAEFEVINRENYLDFLL